MLVLDGGGREAQEVIFGENSPTLTDLSAQARGLPGAPGDWSNLVQVAILLDE